MSAILESRTWPKEGLTRVPYWVYQDPQLYEREQERIFRGNAWTFLGLEAEVANPGDYKTSFVGDMPVVLTRDGAGALHAWENRCAHRGALLALRNQGNAKEFACVYHNWTYDLSGTLTGVAFRRGVNGQGGMPPDAKPESQAPKKLRVESYCGLVFGTLSPGTPPLEAYLGENIAQRIRRVMKEPVKLLGSYSQMFSNNWKLYMDNVKDSYHASLLHLFFTTFRLNRLSQKGGVMVGGDGGNHVSYSMKNTGTSGEEYQREKLRSSNDAFGLEAPGLLEAVDEIGDGITLQILSVFPGFVLQQIFNSLAVRQIIPKGVGRSELVWTCFGYESDDAAMTARRLRQANLVGPAGFISMEDGAATGFVQRGVAGSPDRASFIEMGGDQVASSESRVTETSVRGLWKSWRGHMGI